MDNSRHIKNFKPNLLILHIKSQPNFLAFYDIEMINEYTYILTVILYKISGIFQNFHFYKLFSVSFSTSVISVGKFFQPLKISASECEAHWW